MDGEKAALLHALAHRQDDYALALITENPDLIDEHTVRLALDNGCVKVIRYLRRENRITMAGKEERDRERLDETNDGISLFNEKFLEIEKYLK